MFDLYADTMEIEGLIIEIAKPGNNDDEKKRYGAVCTSLRNHIGMKRPEFAEWLGIPYRTLQDWELGNYKMPEYVLRLIAYKVKMEEMLRSGKLKVVE